MFTDYLSQLVAANVSSDNFGEATPQEIKEAISIIRAGKPIEGNTPKTIIARHLFAKTLKDLLQDPTSDLSQKLQGQKILRESLQDSYLHSIQQLNKFFGYQHTKARMQRSPIRSPSLSPPQSIPSPFIVPKITAVAGKKMKRIGEGSYGTVYKTSKDLAIKSVSNIYTEDLPQDILRETAILHYLNHPNVIKLIAMQLEPAMIAMPLADGTLDDYELKDINQRKWVFYQLFRGLAYCHSKYVWHRDIKSQNVLMFGGESGIAALADFGISIAYARRKQSSDLEVVTLWYRAPEILLGDSKYTETIDVWSLGVVLLDMIKGSYSIPGDSEYDQLSRIFKLLGTPTENTWPGYTQLAGIDYPSYKRTLESSTTFDPQELQVLQSALEWPPKRLTALEILQLPYFDSVRNEVEINIPARPITIESCGQVMLEDQKAPTTIPVGAHYRQVLYAWMWKVRKDFDLTYQSLFYTYALFDLFVQENPILNEELQLYACAAGKIACDLFETSSPPIQRWIDIAGKYFSSRELVVAENKILTFFDFELIFPTCSDFIYTYTEDISIPEQDLQKIYYYALLLVLNPNFVAVLTAAQLAQYAIDEAGVTTTCPSPTKLYTDKIKQYFAILKTLPKSLADLEEDHKKFF